MLMKRLKILLLFFSLIFLIIRMGNREMEVSHSYSSTSENYRVDRITVLSNEIYFTGKQKVAEKIVEKYLDNDFKNIKFSFHNISPNHLITTVYQNELMEYLGIVQFSFEYKAIDSGEEWNMFNNPEKYTIFFPGNKM